MVSVYLWSIVAIAWARNFSTFHTLLASQSTALDSHLGNCKPSLEQTLNWIRPRQGGGCIAADQLTTFERALGWSLVSTGAGPLYRRSDGTPGTRKLFVDIRSYGMLVL